MIDAPIVASKNATGPALVIVESPAKARTIARFLGDGYDIEASVGHIRDLPANASEIPAKYKKEKWSRLGINIEDDFKPLYIVPKEKRDHMKRLKEKVKAASEIYLATDEDREGESISWHLVEELKPKVEYKRLVFHEITKAAIQRAMESPRDIDYNLVEAQETRRLMDRLYGYEVSPLLWKKIRPKLSAGRVQSVAVRLVIERERERMRFVASDYWSLDGTFQTQKDPSGKETVFDAGLIEVGGKRVAVGKDFDPDTGKLREGKDVAHLTEESARALAERLTGVDARVDKLEQKPYTEKPQAPFTTSTLQQDASRRLSFTAKRTMRAAQRLYENGYITYMRTDSTTLSDEALRAARGLIEQRFGGENVPDEPRVYVTKVKNAQEAHEAIRPAGAEFRDPADLGSDMGQDEKRLYELIWKRTVASQMKDARGKRTSLVVAVDDCRFQATGRVIEFPGFRLAYADPKPQSEEGAADAKKSDDRILPAVTEGEAVATDALTPEGHTTKPPARLTEASLIREMEARGIGRPSTYASIIDTILQREYCFKKGSALVPTFTAFSVIKLLDSHLGYLIDYAFTARMEDDLDEISNGREQRLAYLRRFYHGNGRPGLKDTLDEVAENIDPRTVCTIDDYDLGKGPDGEPIEVRVGRYGPFLSSGEVRASLPDGLAPDELDEELATDLIQKAAEGPKSLGTDPDSGLPIFVKTGRFGPYFQLGDPETLGDEKPKMASLLAGMEPETVTLDEALKVLALPRTVGEGPHPESGEVGEVVASNGRFGPYLKWGKDTRSIPPEDDLLTIGMERAIELFKQPKTRGRTARAKPKVLKELGEHPQSGEPVRILDGRYGPYVTDGEINASLPKGEELDAVQMDRAVELLEARAAKAPRKKKAKKKAAKKKAAKKKAAKKAPRKKTAKEG